MGEERERVERREERRGREERGGREEVRERRAGKEGEKRGEGKRGEGERERREKGRVREEIGEDISDGVAVQSGWSRIHRQEIIQYDPRRYCLQASGTLTTYKTSK